MYQYFVAYRHSTGYGNLVCTLSHEITDMHHISDIQKHIALDVKEKEGVEIKGVCITNFQFLKEQSVNENQQRVGVR